MQHYTCSDGKCELEISHLRYVYEDDNKVPEGWITDDYALDKKKTKIIPGVLRPRVKTVDRMDDLYTGLNNSFLVSIAQVQTTPTATQPAQPLAPASPATETNKQVTTPATTIASVTPIQQPTGNPPVKSTTINEQSVAETPAPLEPLSLKLQLRPRDCLPVTHTIQPIKSPVISFTCWKSLASFLPSAPVQLSTWQLLSGEVWVHCLTNR